MNNFNAQTEPKICFHQKIICTALSSPKNLHSEAPLVTHFFIGNSLRRYWRLFRRRVLLENPCSEDSPLKIFFSEVFIGDPEACSPSILLSKSSSDCCWSTRRSASSTFQTSKSSSVGESFSSQIFCNRAFELLQNSCKMFDLGELLLKTLFRPGCGSYSSE